MEKKRYLPPPVMVLHHPSGFIGKCGLCERSLIEGVYGVNLHLGGKNLVLAKYVKAAGGCSNEGCDGQRKLPFVTDDREWAEKTARETRALIRNGEAAKLLFIPLTHFDMDHLSIR
jgi:hypothetical protein